MHRATITFFLMWVFHVFACFAWAEPKAFHDDADYLIDTWETEDGLPENSATAMVQTSGGRLMFGTFGGLVLFDGVDFEVMNPRNTPGLVAAGIVNLHQDRSGRLWVSTYGGLLTLHEGRWHRFTAADGWTGDFVRVFAERENGDMLFSSFDNQVFEYCKGKFTMMPSPPGQTASAKYVHADEQGKWWIISGTFVGYWEGDQWNAVQELSAQAKEPWGGKARDGGFWLLQDRTLTKINRGVATATRTMPEHAGGVWGIHEDSSGHLWVTTHDNGVCRVDAEGGMRRFAAGQGLAASSVRFVHEDREKNLWIGTSGGGLTRLRPRRFKSLGIESGIALPNIKSISADRDGGVWIATYGSGLQHWNGQQLKRFPTAQGMVANMQSVLHDRAGRVWVGSFAAPLMVIDRDQVRTITDPSNGGLNGIALFEDSQGRIWVSGGQHVAVHDGEQHTIYGNEKSQPLWGVFHFAQTADGTIWAMNHKLHKLVGDQFELQYEPGKDRRINSIWGDREGSLWIGTQDGLTRWRDGQMDAVDARHGLRVSSVHGMIEDKTGHLWLATTMGVVRVRLDELHAVADGKQAKVSAHHFDRTDGLPSLHCSTQRQPVCAMDAKGRLWFATLKGAASIDPSALTFSDTPPTVRFKSISFIPPQESERTRLDLNDATVVTLGTQRATPILIPPGGRSITVRYAASSLTTTKGVLHEVRLNNEPWQSLGEERQVSFHELSPGDHLLQVRACNRDGIWSIASASLALTVEPYLWQTVWFRLLALAVLAGMLASIGWWLAHRRHTMLRQEQEHFEMLVDASPSAMLMIDAHGRIVLSNDQARRTFGDIEDQLRKVGIRALLPELDFDQHWALLSRSDAHDEMMDAPLPLEHAAKRINGESFPAEVRLRALKTAKGPFMLASIDDVSERQRTELEVQRQRNELAHLSRVSLLGELSGSMAHELNQPLASILSNAQAAQRFLDQDQTDLTEVREILKDIVDEDKRAGEVIRRLRLLLKKGEIQRLPLDINEVVLEVLRLVRSDLINNGVEAITDLWPDLPLIDGDRVQFQQVLLNLVMNACDAMHELPTGQRVIRLRTRPIEGAGIHLQLSDQGVGIPEERLQTIFDPFMTTKSTGMGLGLSVCRTIVTAHGGKLWASNNDSGGATFHLMMSASKIKETS